jgi:hypothetical protein
MLPAAFAVVVLVAPIVAGHTQSGPSPGNGIHVRTLALPGSTDVADVAGYGSSIVMTGRHARDNLYRGSLSGPWRPHRIYAAASGVYPSQLQISARWIAWQNTTHAGGPWAILAMSLNSSRIFTVDSSSKEGLPPTEVAFPIISMYGDTLAWSYSRCASRCKSQKPVIASSIATESLPHGRRHIITSTFGRCGSLWPSIWSRTVVWFQEGVCHGQEGNDVVMYDGTTGRTRQLTHDHQSSVAATNGRYVAWKFPGTRFTINNSIMLLDLKTGRRRLASLVLGRWRPTAARERSTTASSAMARR